MNILNFPMKLYERILKSNEIEVVKPYKRTHTTRFFDRFNAIMFLCGFNNFWIEEVPFSRKFVKYYNFLDVILRGFCLVYCILLLGAPFVQMELTAKQKSERNMMAVSLPLTYMNSVIFFINRKEIRQLFYYLAVVLKEHYNDEDIEAHMIRKIKTYMVVFTLCIVFTVLLFGLLAFIECFTTGSPFVTTITMWPDIKDLSPRADATRITLYVVCLITDHRIVTVYILIMPMLLGLNYQYMNLQSYFYSLSNIFEEKILSQQQKEEKYEEAFKLGIKMHQDTLWCTKKCQEICKLIFSNLIIFAIGVLINIMPALVNCRDNIDLAMAHFATFMCILLVMGFFMWSGGDIIHEAGRLSDAMYGSGWENCYGQASVRVRKLVVTAMAQAQRPVILTALGVVELSYNTYAAMIKNAYSAFSVFY